MLKTGYFKQIDSNVTLGYVSISLYPSKNNNVLFEFKSLVPNWKLMEMLKSKHISEYDFEKEYLITQLKKNHGNISKTADFIGMERSALHRKLKELGIKGIN